MGLTDRTAGFTLIELVVVMSMISLLFVFTLPRFQSAVISSPTTTVSQWIVANVQSLRERSLRDQKPYALNISIGEGLLWVTDATMNDEDLVSAEQGAFVVPKEVSILDVEYPVRGVVSIGNAVIYFNERGYSDKAIIHIENDNRDRISLLIEPFLTRVEVFKEYRSFRD